MCQFDTYDPCPGAIVCEKKTFFVWDPAYVRDKRTRVMFQILLYVCTLYFTVKAVENLLV